MTTPGTPITPGSPSSTVTPGETVRPVHTGQKAQLEKADQCLAQSELPVLNSPIRLVQLEHNVHEPLGNMPTLQIEHLSEHSQVFQVFTNSDSPNIRADKSPARTHLRHSGHRFRASVTPATHWASVTLVTVQTMSIQSSDLGRYCLMLLSMGQTEPDIALMSLVLHGEIVTHIVKLFPSDTLTQVNSLQLRLSDIVAVGAVPALTTLSLRDVIVGPPLVREGRRSHIRRGSTLPLLVLLLAALPLLPLEKEKESGTGLKEEEETL